MVIDVHCHVGLSARRVSEAIPRFSFERNGAIGTSGFDSYVSPRLLGKFAWYFVRRWLGVPQRLDRGDAFDAIVEEVNERHFSQARSVDRLVLLAFDEYHDDAGNVVGIAERRQRVGSDLYTSNSLVRAMCAARPDRYLFGASLHPYRKERGRDACELLDELAAAGAVLVKWLPIHQNIDIEDARSVAFLRRAAELNLPMLIHYGGEMSLARQHMEFESPIPLLGVLRRLREAGRMPTTIVAHVATPSFLWQSRRGHDALIDAMLGEFADAPLYADISALGAPGRTAWMRRLARREELHSKLLWGSDYPIPVFLPAFWTRTSGANRRAIAAEPSWIERSLLIAKACGMSDEVFTQAASVLMKRAGTAC